MDIRQLSYFTEVAKQMSFSKAAEQLRVSQPSLSKMVKTLEDELGVVLFDRTTKKMELTDAGKIVIVKAQEITRLIQNLSSELSDVMKIKKGSIKIGIPPIIGSLFFPKLVSDFQLLYPNIEVELVEEGAKIIEKLVQEGSVDVGISLLPIDEDLFNVYPFAFSKLMLIVYPEHLLANAKQVSLFELRDEPIILLRKEFALHNLIFESCIQAGFEPTISFESSQWDFIGEMVANKLGVSIFPEALCQKLESSRIKTIPIVNPGIDWNLGMIWRKNKYLSYVSNEFIRFFSNSYQNESFN